jgi:hypothetical protein
MFDIKPRGVKPPLVQRSGKPLGLFLDVKGGFGAAAAAAELALASHTQDLPATPPEVCASTPHKAGGLKF